MRRVSASRVLAPLAVVMVLAGVYGLTLVNHAATLGAGQQVLKIGRASCRERV